MKAEPKDWRAPLMLGELETYTVLEYLRHQYLNAAKDLCKLGRELGDVQIGEYCLKVALHIQGAMDEKGSYQNAF